METDNLAVDVPAAVDVPVVSVVKKKPKKKTKHKTKQEKRKDYPKHFKNGYVRFCEEMRPIVCVENPIMDPVEVTKLVAAKWFALSHQEKQPFMDQAKIDKDRFKRELKEFHKLHPESLEDKNTKSKLKEGKACVNGQTAEESIPTTNNNVDVVGKHFSEKKNSEIWLRIHYGTNYELPIFAEPFLEHNKTIESELKSLRKNISEIEQQNSVLMKHVENMENGVTKVEGEISSTKLQNRQLEMYLTKMKIILASGLNSLTCPALKSGASVENIDIYMNSLSSELSVQKSPGIVNKAASIIRKIDLK